MLGYIKIMLEAKYNVIDNSISINIKDNAFQDGVIERFLYNYSNKFQNDYRNKANGQIITLIPNSREVLNSSNYLEIIKKINQDLTDINLQVIINNETRQIRELLIAKSFDSIDDK